MASQLLLDTHIVVRWLNEPSRLSREQRRLVENAEKQGDFLNISAMSLLEIATMNEGKQRLSFKVEDLLDELDSNPIFRILPITTEIAREVAALRNALRDPGDSAIVATARVHGLRLLTADQRIIDSRLVPVIE